MKNSPTGKPCEACRSNPGRAKLEPPRMNQITIQPGDSEYEKRVKEGTSLTYYQCPVCGMVETPSDLAAKIQQEIAAGSEAASKQRDDEKEGLIHGDYGTCALPDCKGNILAEVETVSSGSGLGGQILDGDLFVRHTNCVKTYYCEKCGLVYHGPRRT